MSGSNMDEDCSGNKSANVPFLPMDNTKRNIRSSGWAPMGRMLNNTMECIPNKDDKHASNMEPKYRMH